MLRSGSVCAYCKHKGYLLSECWALEKKEKSNQRLNSVMVMSVAGDKNPSSGSIKEPPKKVHNVCKPFLPEGFVTRY